MHCTALLQVSRHFGPGHFGPKTFRYRQTGAEVSRQFGTSAEVSHRHFGTGTELSQPPYIIYHFYPTIFLLQQAIQKKGLILQKPRTATVITLDIDCDKSSRQVIDLDNLYRQIVEVDNLSKSIAIE